VSANSQKCALEAVKKKLGENRGVFFLGVSPRLHPEESSETPGFPGFFTNFPVSPTKRGERSLKLVIEALLRGSQYNLEYLRGDDVAPRLLAPDGDIFGTPAEAIAVPFHP
jgi:hypothetical protein